MIGHTFDCNEERAALLAGLGLVEPAEGAQAWPPAERAAGTVPDEPVEQEAEKPASSDPNNGPTRAQLVERCEELGIEYPSKANKAKLSQLIAEAEAGE